MTNILSRSREDITEADIRALVETKAPENETLEFKGGLPTETGEHDPWTTGKDAIGDQAKRKILEEAVAFANAFGGVLMLGVAEANGAATSIRPIRECKALAERLEQVFWSFVDPQLPLVEIFGVETENSAGVVLIRAPKSRLAPHAVRYFGKSRNARNYLKCPIRRSDRCEAMTMREIQDMTLNLSQGLQRLENELATRKDLFFRQFDRLWTPADAYGLRFTAIPVGNDVQIDRLLDGHVLDPRFGPPSISVVRSLPKSGTSDVLQGFEHIYGQSYSGWMPRLRAARTEASVAGWSDISSTAAISYQEVHFGGLVELGFLSVRQDTGDHGGRQPPRLPHELPVVEFAKLMTWAHQVRKEAGAPTAEYAIEVQIASKVGPLQVINHRSRVGRELGYLDPDSTPFPRYPLAEPEDFPKLLEVFQQDFLNACGRDFGDQQGSLTIRKSSRT